MRYRRGVQEHMRVESPALVDIVGESLADIMPVMAMSDDIERGHQHQQRVFLVDVYREAVVSIGGVALHVCGVHRGGIVKHPMQQCCVSALSCPQWQCHESEESKDQDLMPATMNVHNRFLFSFRSKNV